MIKFLLLSASIAALAAVNLTFDIGIDLCNSTNMNLQVAFHMKAMTSQLNRDLDTLETQKPTLFDRIFRDSEGNIVIAQMPNLPVSVGLAATFLQFILPAGKLQIALELVAFGTLFTWAWQELFAGVNYFRRGLGFTSLLGLMVLALYLSGV